MAINEKISIVLGDNKMFGISIIDGIITEESFKEGKRSISVSTISPLKTPDRKFSDPKEELEFTRYKHDCRKRALDLGHSKWEKDGSDSIKIAEQYYTWLTKDLS